MVHKFQTLRHQSGMKLENPNTHNYILTLLHTFKIYGLKPGWNRVTKPNKLVPNPHHPKVSFLFLPLNHLLKVYRLRLLYWTDGFLTRLIYRVLSSFCCKELTNFGKRNMENDASICLISFDMLSDRTSTHIDPQMKSYLKGGLSMTQKTTYMTNR